MQSIVERLGGGHGQWQREWPWVLMASVGVYFYAPDPNLGPSIALLWAIWRFTPMPGLPPAIPLALTYQWAQAVTGSWYIALTGRELPAFYVSGIDTTVLIALGAVAAVALGVAVGTRLLRPPQAGADRRFDALFTTRILIICYVVMLLFEGTLQRLALERQSLQQALIAIQMARYGILFLLVRRFLSPLNVPPILVLLGVELALGFSGYFADFKEPLAIMTLVVLERFDRRRPGHWASLATLAVLSLVLATAWIAVRGELRADIQREELSTRSERGERMLELASSWARLERETFMQDVDALVDRVWVQYYPALAIRRVPSVLPHSGGEFLRAAIAHVLMPRILFPNKPPLQGDSDKVRYYSGVWVAGESEGTTIALGYTTEMYLDFGVPLMFLPIFVYGVVLGLAFAFFRRMIFVPQLAVALLTVVCWLSLYLHEDAFAKMLGDAFTLFAYLGGLTFLIDRFLAGGRLASHDAQYDATLQSWRASSVQETRRR